MSEQFIETSTQSWGKRLIGSITGVLFGVIFFIGAFILIWWNEGNSVERIKTLNEASNRVIAISPTTISAGNENALIHMSGIANTDQILNDSSMGVSAKALIIDRKVEMFQWREIASSEKKKDLGGSTRTKTTYSYSKVWSETLLPSDDFKQASEHRNPSSMALQSKTITNPNVKIGSFNLSNVFVQQIENASPYTLSQENYNAADARLKSDFQLHDGRYFKGDPSAPQIGATRVSYSIVMPQSVSVMGKQAGSTLETYTTKNGEIALLELGAVGSDVMIKEAKTQNKIMTWAFRLGALLMMWFGMNMFFAPLKVFGDVIPFAGSIIGAGIGLVTGVASLVLSFFTIALAWLFFRPLIGVGLLIVAACVLFFGYKFLSQRRPEHSESAVGNVSHNRLSMINPQGSDTSMNTPYAAPNYQPQSYVPQSGQQAYSQLQPQFQPQHQPQFQPQHQVSNPYLAPSPYNSAPPHPNHSRQPQNQTHQPSSNYPPQQINPQPMQSGHAPQPYQPQAYNERPPIAPSK